MENTPQTPDADCWNTIGIWGDRKCPELDRWLHCRNCPVYQEAGQRFLERPAPEGYLERLAQELAAPSPADTGPALSHFVFRVADAWLAVRTGEVVQVSPLRPAHRIPFREHEVFKGLVNVDGALELCASLHALLELKTPGTFRLRKSRNAVPRLVTLQHQDARWTFVADELHGRHSCPAGHLRPAATNAGGAGDRFLLQAFSWEDLEVRCLDTQALFLELDRRALA